MNRVESLRGQMTPHGGGRQTAWVVMSGASMGYVQPAFFIDKLVVTVNEAFRSFPCVYALMNHHEHVAEALAAHHLVVAPDYDCGVPRWGDWQLPADRSRLYQFRHDVNQLTKPLDVPAALDTPDTLVMSASTAATAIHFAYLLGATFIVLCGMDGGLLDGEMNYPGYNHGGSTQLEHARMTAHLFVAVIDALRRRGVGIYSLNPFYNLTLEDHLFESLTEDLATVRTFVKGPDDGVL